MGAFTRPLEKEEAMSTEFSLGREPAGSIDEISDREPLSSAPSNGATPAKIHDRAFDRLEDRFILIAHNERVDE